MRAQTAVLPGKMRAIGTDCHIGAFVPPSLRLREVTEKRPQRNHKEATAAIGRLAAVFFAIS